MRTFIVTKVARTEGGDDSAMYTGLVTDARPTPRPTTTRPACAASDALAGSEQLDQLRVS